jgi:hypothetical protein
MTTAADLQVWAVAKGDDVLVVSALCAEHAAVAHEQVGLPIGFHAFRVRARAWVRRVLSGSSRCSECATRGRAIMRLVDVGPIGDVRVGHLSVDGGEA